MTGRDEYARIIDPKAFVIENSKRWEVREAQARALEKADAILALRSAAAPAVGAEPVAPLCTFGPPAERKRRWILRFADTDVGDMHFDDEGAAHKKFEQSSDAWTCTLYETANRKYNVVFGELVPLTTPPDHGGREAVDTNELPRLTWEMMTPAQRRWYKYLGFREDET